MFDRNKRTMWSFLAFSGEWRLWCIWRLTVHPITADIFILFPTGRAVVNGLRKHSRPHLLGSTDKDP